MPMSICLIVIAGLHPSSSSRMLPTQIRKKRDTEQKTKSTQHLTHYKNTQQKHNTKPQTKKKLTADYYAKRRGINRSCPFFFQLFFRHERSLTKNKKHIRDAIYLFEVSVCSKPANPYTELVRTTLGGPTDDTRGSYRRHSGVLRTTLAILPTTLGGSYRRHWRLLPTTLGGPTDDTRGSYRRHLGSYRRMDILRAHERGRSDDHARGIKRLERA